MLSVRSQKLNGIRDHTNVKSIRKQHFQILLVTTLVFVGSVNAVVLPSVALALCPHGEIPSILSARGLCPYYLYFPEPRGAIDPETSVNYKRRRSLV